MHHIRKLELLIAIHMYDSWVNDLRMMGSPLMSWPTHSSRTLLDANRRTARSDGVRKRTMLASTSVGSASSPVLAGSCDRALDRMVLDTVRRTARSDGLRKPAMLVSASVGRSSSPALAGCSGTLAEAMAAMRTAVGVWIQLQESIFFWLLHFRCRRKK